jgi:hypothetical protein
VSESVIVTETNLNTLEIESNTVRVEQPTIQTVQTGGDTLLIETQNINVVEVAAHRLIIEEIISINVVTAATQINQGGGVTDHGNLTGLGDDDHTQYHNDARGDARYYTKAEIDALLAQLVGGTPL